MKMLRIAIPVFYLAGCTAGPTSGTTRDVPTVAERRAKALRVNGRVNKGLLLASSAASSADRHDKFGVKEFEPTQSGGREWFLSNTTLATDPEAFDENGTVSNIPVDCGVYSASDMVRLSIISLDGGPWWRNVEMTGYFKLLHTQDGGPGGQEPHWEFQVRGERHSSNPTDESDINFGVHPPKGTATWPGYPYAAGKAVKPPCLGTAYHANIYPNGNYHLQKEISHTDGYGDDRASGSVDLVDGGYFGLKFLVRNRTDAGTVSLVTYIDPNGDGGWTLGSSATDVGSWSANTTTLNGCTAAPYKYATDEILTWAGPWATFRADSASYIFKWLSVREVDPLP